MVKNKKEKNISLKNYVYAFLLLVGAILLVLYIFSWYQTKEKEILENSYLLSSRTIETKIRDLDSLEQFITEAPSSYFIYVSYPDSKEIYNFERKLKRVIDQYKLNDSFYYVDATNNKDNEEYLNKLNKIFNTNKVNKIPSIIYVQESKVVDVLNSESNSVLKIDDFKKLLDTYEFEIVK